MYGNLGLYYNFLKVKFQEYPRLYVNISSQNKYCKLEYYNNQYCDNGNLKLNSALVPSEKFIDAACGKQKLNNLNKAQLQLLDSLIKKQKKVIEIYLAKNKTEQYQTINSSLKLLLKYRELFLDWFSKNKILL